MPVLRARVPHQAALLPRPYLGRRRKNGRKIEILEEGEGLRG